MIEQLLSVMTSDDPRIPSRICALLAQRGHGVNGLQMTRQPDEGQWTIFLSVHLHDQAELELLVKRLNRLIDVVKVTVVGPSEHHHRRSLFVRLQPPATDIIHVSEIARLFGAEVLELTPKSATLHICAAPARCLEFLAMIRSYSVMDIAWGAVSGMRAGTATYAPVANANERQKCLR